ncbi:MAG TPA: hypothetical protein VF194_02820 [Ferrovibrio sp.]|uniref:hypothetical protein n=1 Tax=Ferrovibrio sp. TaxID=1917215 RepID=UPI002ED4D25B
MSYRKIHRPFAVAAIAMTLLASLGIAAAAQAQQMGREGWNFNGRNKSMAAQFDFTRRMQQDQNSAGLAALQQYVTTYNSSSTSIGNLNQVTQNLSDGSTGTVSNGANQASNGNQGADASTGVTYDNSLQVNNTSNGSHHH